MAAFYRPGLYWPQDHLIDYTADQTSAVYNAASATPARTKRSPASDLPRRSPTRPNFIQWREAVSTEWTPFSRDRSFGPPGANMVIDALTPEEIARHERAIAKIRRKLFVQHTPDEFAIVPGSERVLSATAEQRWCASEGEYRRMTWGGLRFTLAIGPSRYELTVSHCERDVFLLHIANERGNTELVSPVKFNELDRVAWTHIERFRR